MDKSGISPHAHHLHAGFKPACFDTYKGSFSFALVHVDRFEPTRTSLDWFWPRIAYGGILLPDIYFPAARSLPAQPSMIG